MNNTRNLENLGFREIDMLGELLKAYSSQSVDENFYNEGVNWEFNPSSGNIFLVNEENQVLMMNGDTIEMWHYLPYSGKEGFTSELIEMYNNGEIVEDDDIEYMINYEMVKPRHTYEQVAEWVREMLECSKDSKTLEQIEDDLYIINELMEVHNGTKTHNEMCTDSRCTVSDYEDMQDCEVVA